MNRVFVFGLDAASPFLIERWLDHLPNLARLSRQGVWGELESTIPPFTSPAWACMATGKNPARVGLFGLRHRRHDSYKLEPPTSAHRRAKAVWDIAGEAGLPTITVNVPDTYPPPKVNGILVSGRPAPSLPGAKITYPAAVRDELERACGGYLLGPVAEFDEGSRKEELSTWFDVQASQQQALEYLLQHKPWSLFFYVSMAIDAVCHHFWQHLDPSHPDYDSDTSPAYADAILRIYKREDERIGRVMEYLGPEDTLLVVSDHGSSPCHAHIAVNRWLIDAGYLVLQEREQRASQRWLGPLSTRLFAFYRSSALLRRLVAPLRRTAIRDQVVGAHFAHRSRGRIRFDELLIDWRRTRAYYLGDDRLYLNVAGREPLGIVRPGQEYERERERLATELRNAREPGTDRPLFAHVHYREELYRGPYLEDAPDLVLVPADQRWNLGGAVGDTVFDRPVVVGKHHPLGVFLAMGRDIEAGLKVQSSIYDIAPTILHLLNLPVPADSDGTVRREWFRSGSEPRTRDVRYAEVAEAEIEAHAWNPEESESIEERLRSLGYLD